MKTQETLLKERKEILDSQAKILGMDRDYEPIVVMDDIRQAPEEMWHMCRQKGWGGSDEGDLNGMGYSGIKLKTMEKVLGTKKSVDTDSQFRFDFGHANEWIALKAYAVRNGYKYLTYTNYFVVLKTSDDVSMYPFMKKALTNPDDSKPIYTALYKQKEEAELMLNLLKKDFPDAYICAEESNEAKDIREITDEEHEAYDAQGIVCVDRRQYRSPLYPCMFGDCDGIAITPSGIKIGLEVKTYGREKVGTFTSGVLGDEGVKIKNPEYALQVAHYMHVLNIDRFDIVAMVGNNPQDVTITTVYRDLQLEKLLCENCQSAWEKVKNYEIPDENRLSDAKLDSLIQMLSMKEPVPATKELSDETLSIVTELEKLDELVKQKENEKKIFEEQANAFKARLLEELKANDDEYFEKGIVHADGFDYVISAPSSSQTRLDEKKLKAQCPDIYSEYEKSKSFSAWLKVAHPDVVAEYKKCLVTSPKIKYWKSKAGIDA